MVASLKVKESRTIAAPYPFRKNESEKTWHNTWLQSTEAPSPDELMVSRFETKSQPESQTPVVNDTQLQTTAHLGKPFEHPFN
jgi:hypothetical protein